MFKLVPGGARESMTEIKIELYSINHSSRNKLQNGFALILKEKFYVYKLRYSGYMQYDKSCPEKFPLPKSI